MYLTEGILPLDDDVLFGSIHAFVSWERGIRDAGEASCKAQYLEIEPFDWENGSFPLHFPRNACSIPLYIYGTSYKGLDPDYFITITPVWGHMSTADVVDRFAQNLSNAMSTRQAIIATVEWLLDQIVNRMPTIYPSLKDLLAMPEHEFSLPLFVTFRHVDMILPGFRCLYVQAADVPHIDYIDLSAIYKAFLKHTLEYLWDGIFLDSMMPFYDENRQEEIISTLEELDATIQDYRLDNADRFFKKMKEHLHKQTELMLYLSLKEVR